MTDQETDPSPTKFDPKARKGGHITVFDFLRSTVTLKIYSR